MIKETVDAIRLAEKEAQEIIDTAKSNANDKKIRIKQEAEAYREGTINSAQAQAKEQMQDTIRKCEEYNDLKTKEVEEKIEELKSKALKSFDKAVDAVISALV